MNRRTFAKKAIVGGTTLAIGTGVAIKTVAQTTSWGDYLVFAKKHCTIFDLTKIPMKQEVKETFWNHNGKQLSFPYRYGFACIKDPSSGSMLVPMIEVVLKGHDKQKELAKEVDRMAKEFFEAYAPENYQRFLVIDRYEEIGGVAMVSYGAYVHLTNVKIEGKL